VSSGLPLTPVISVLLPVALLLAGCDREAPADVQEQGALGDAKAGFSGELDRSHEGELMPAVAVADPSGNALNTGALQGGPVLLNLWATWCAPCVVEMPILDDLAAEYGDALRIITVSQDMQGAEKVVPFFAEREFKQLEPWLDPDNTLGFGIGGGVLPTTVLYDSQGREIWRVVGEYDWASAEAREAISEAVE